MAADEKEGGTAAKRQAVLQKKPKNNGTERAVPCGQRRIKGRLCLILKAEKLTG